MKTWREIQKETFTSVEALSSFLQLDETNRELLLKAPSFPLKLPYRLAKKIEPNTLKDPILRQFVPLLEEEERVPQFTKDPVEDASFRKAPRLLQKYDSRVLFVLTNSCAMNCRFCFRKEFDYERGKPNFTEELSQISNDQALKEVILSGGDPLSLPDAVLKDLLFSLDGISHLKRVRFHTRFPIGVPERIDASFLDLLSKLRLQVWFVIHVNHARELDADVLAALKKVGKLGIPLLSQTVLLKGVNDKEETLLSLFETLVDHAIVPYYLHQLDRVLGTAHLEVSEERGRELITFLATRLSGYGVPKYVKEVPGSKGKTPL